MKINTLMAAVPMVFTFPGTANIFGDKRDYVRGFGYQGGGTAKAGEKITQSFPLAPNTKRRLLSRAAGTWVLVVLRNIALS
jgi:hypothetical protein